jgi:hypothetical protein
VSLMLPRVELPTDPLGGTRKHDVDDRIYDRMYMA